MAGKQRNRETEKQRNREIVTLPEITIFGTVPKPDQAAYDTADEAGMAAISFIIQKSIKELREYVGLVYQNPNDSKYYFGNPRIGMLILQVQVLNLEE